MRRVGHLAMAVESAAIAGLGLTALLLAAYAVAARYFLPDMNSDWALDIIVITIVWSAFLSAGRLARQNGHIRVDILHNILPAPAVLVIEAFAMLVMVGAVSLIAWSGVPVVLESIAWDERSTSSLRLPMWIYYLSLPVGMSSVAIQAVFGYLTLLRDGGATEKLDTGLKGID